MSTTPDRLTDQQLDELEALIGRTTPVGAVTASPGLLPMLVAELRQARARVAELEGPAVEARAALAALCYDLEDPGTAALGALYLISQATVGVEAPRDDAALALAQHDAEVLREAAQVLEETDRDDDAVNLLYLLADGKVSASRTTPPAPAAPPTPVAR